MSRLNREKTIEKYMARMRKKGAEDKSFFEPLRGAYLSTYNIFSTIHEPFMECSRFMFFNVFAIHLLLYVRSLGIPVKGVTSERKEKGKYICPERANKKHKIIYVGKYNYFSQTTASPYAPTRSDQVFYAPDDDTSETTFVEYL
ncbi:hypothetical protein OAM67_00955 [bacterium]|nr:hypothetical protein [bacterium]